MCLDVSEYMVKSYVKTLYSHYYSRVEKQFLPFTELVRGESLWCTDMRFECAFCRCATIFESFFTSREGFSNHLPGQLIPMFDSPFLEESPPDIQLEPPLVQHGTLSSHSSAS